MARPPVGPNDYPSDQLVVNPGFETGSSTQEKRNRTELKGTIRIDKVELKSTQNLSGNPFHPGTYTGQLRGTTLENDFQT
jgi:hypothetical protein